MIAWLLKRYGTPIQSFIEKRLNRSLAVLGLIAAASRW